MKYQIMLVATLYFLAACTGSEETTAPTTTAVVTEAGEITQEEQIGPAPNTAVPEPTAVAAPTVEVATVEVPAEETAVPAVEAIDVTYFTPAQQEGPYYTVNKPEDRDNDLVDFAGASGVPNGQILEFGGKVYDANGLPVVGLTVEIWQTDENGVYLHPGDPDTASRDPNFQFYGEALTDAAGSYSFRTILPGQYEPRPPHIHFKVKLDGQELLTSQFYFAGTGEDAALLITAVAAQDAGGNAILIGERDIILSNSVSTQ